MIFTGITFIAYCIFTILIVTYFFGVIKNESKNACKC